MLSLTRKVDYALVAMVDLAQRAPELVSAREIAERLHLPLPMLTNILNQLKTAGLVTSCRGVYGGYCLARRPEQISLAELIDAVEGPFRLTVCCGDEPEAEADCSRHVVCGVKDPVRRLHRQLREFLGGVSVAHIACDAVPVSLMIETSAPAAAPAPVN